MYMWPAAEALTHRMADSTWMLPLVQAGLAQPVDKYLNVEGALDWLDVHKCVRVAAERDSLQGARRVAVGLPPRAGSVRDVLCAQVRADYGRSVQRLCHGRARWRGRGPHVVPMGRAAAGGAEPAGHVAGDG